ncbi:hypothetical protein BYT27DRAFT_7249744 [Phlegmacium glaucopus]|nr:hypothetical protein BYT27DRAFT_7249744 [Phlegmacium glaucopus]
MLRASSSRAFLRSPWLCTGRMLRTRELSYPQFVYGARHGTTLSFRHTHSVADQPDLEPESASAPPSEAKLFEDSSEEYAHIASGSLPPPTSILEILEQKLPDLLPEHSPDDAIFEVEGQEYSAVASSLSRRRSPNSSIRALAQFVELRDFKQAYLLLKDIQDLDIPIPLSFIYEAPAQAALRNGDLHGAKQVEEFTTWFSLIPPAHTSDVIRTFDETCHLIFQAKITNLPLILNFAMIMSSKGYGQKISVQAVPTIMRYSSPEVGLNFLDDFTDADAKYWATHDSKAAAKKSERLTIGVRGLAVRSLAYTGRIDEALSLLPDPKDVRFRLTSYTYDVLLRRLEKSKIVRHRKKILMVEELRSQESTSVFENNSVSPLTILAEEAEMASSLDSALPVDLTENLVDDLRYIKMAFLDEDLTPHPFTIVNFMNAYLATGRTQALGLLYNRAIRTSYRTISTFIFAEMLFYRRLRQHDLVIETFVDHFYLSGVPREHVLNRYHRLSAKRRAYDPATREDPPPARCYNFNLRKALPRGKLWPSSAHCNLVYHALVALTVPGSSLEALYKELMLIIEHGKDAPTTAAIGSVEPLITGSKGRPSSGAFTPFFRRLMQAFGPARGAKILNDMVKIGIKPTVYHYTELAGFYASAGEAERAFLILDNLERRFRNAAQSPTADSDYQGASTTEEHDNLETPESSALPAPDLVMYISLMRGFIMSKNLQAADDVAARLRQLHKYRRGEDKYLDDVYRDIEYMREEYGQQMGSVNAALQRNRT